MAGLRNYAKALARTDPRTALTAFAIATAAIVALGNLAAALTHNTGGAAAAQSGEAAALLDTDANGEVEFTELARAVLTPVVVCLALLDVRRTLRNAYVAAEEALRAATAKKTLLDQQLAEVRGEMDRVDTDVADIRCRDAEPNSRRAANNKRHLALLEKKIQGLHSKEAVLVDEAAKLELALERGNLRVPTAVAGWACRLLARVTILMTVGLVLGNVYSYWSNPRPDSSFAGVVLSSLDRVLGDGDGRPFEWPDLFSAAAAVILLTAALGGDGSK